MINVRLDLKTVESIILAFKNNFCVGDQLLLFGSRTKLEAKGGDIDLYIETNYKDVQEIVDSKIKFLTELYMTLGEEKIDVVIKYDDTQSMIYKVAKTEGIQLV